MNTSSPDIIPITNSKCCKCGDPASSYVNFTDNDNNVYAIQTYCSDKCISEDIDMQDNSIIKYNPPTINLNFHDYSREELGRMSWGLLHAMAKYYEKSPTETQKKSMLNYLISFADNYPCDICKAHLKEEYSLHPPNVNSRVELKKWVCDLHNCVNNRLGKPQYKCVKC